MNSPETKSNTELVFDFKEFERIKFSDRTKELKLKNFGDTADTVAWKIRGLNSADLADIEDAIQRNKSLLDMADILIEAVTESEQTKDKKEALKELTGIDEKTSSHLIRMYVAFELGSVAPKPESRQMTVKFAKVYPVEFRKITNEIFALTGQGGFAKKKPFGSGEEQT